MRRAMIVSSFAGIVLFGLASVQSGLAQRDPEFYAPGADTKAWILGARHDRLEAVAETHVREALARLKDRDLAEADRRAGFREHLELARSLLERSLNACPARAGALATLAAVRWELDPLQDAEEEARTLSLATMAGERAPRVPSVQWKLGDVLLRMGHRGRAMEHFSRAVRLDPDRAEETVSLLRRNMVSPERILRGLPDLARVAASLQEDFFLGGGADRLIEYLEERLISAEPEAPDETERIGWISVYGEACLRAGQFSRLVESLPGPPSGAPGPLRAEILRQRSRGLAGMGRDAEALREAREASDLMPDDGLLLMNLGRIAAGALRHSDALEAYARALHIAAETPWPATSRAWVYSEIGAVHEAMLRPDLAWDSYTQALTLDPARADARARLDAIRRLGAN